MMTQTQDELRQKLDQEMRLKKNTKDFGTLARMAGNIADGLVSAENNHYVDSSGEIDVPKLAKDAAEIARVIAAELRKGEA